MSGSARRSGRARPGGGRRRVRRGVDRQAEEAGQLDLADPDAPGLGRQVGQRTQPRRPTAPTAGRRPRWRPRPRRSASGQDRAGDRADLDRVAIDRQAARRRADHEAGVSRAAGRPRRSSRAAGGCRPGRATAPRRRATRRRCRRTSAGRSGRWPARGGGRPAGRVVQEQPPADDRPGDHLRSVRPGDRRPVHRPARPGRDLGAPRPRPGLAAPGEQADQRQGDQARQGVADRWQHRCGFSSRGRWGRGHGRRGAPPGPERAAAPPPARPGRRARAGTAATSPAPGRPSPG